MVGITRKIIDNVSLTQASIDSAVAKRGISNFKNTALGNNFDFIRLRIHVMVVFHPAKFSPVNAFCRAT